MSDFAELILEGKKYQLPVIKGSQDEKAIDIKKLRAQTGYITLDSGYNSTGSCESSITYIDGEKGVLRYRDSIEQLVEQSTLLRPVIY